MSANGISHDEYNGGDTMERIKTRFAANVDVARVLPEYPRPQLVREGWMNLNGLYDYAVTPHGAQQPERFEGKFLCHSV